jgi:hypothetical protein
MYDLKVPAVNYAIVAPLALAALTACGSAPVAEDPTATPELVDSPAAAQTPRCTADLARVFDPASMTSTELAATAWMDQAELHFYTFTSDAAFEARTEPACTRAAERCEVSVDARRGTFSITRDAVELRYATGEVTAFFAARSCGGTWQLAGEDFGSDLTLVASTVPQ